MAKKSKSDAVDQRLAAAKAVLKQKLAEAQRIPSPQEEDPLTPVPCFSTGILDLDKLISGERHPERCLGWPRGRISHLSGPVPAMEERSLAARLALTTAQKAGADCVYISTEDHIPSVPGLHVIRPKNLTEMLRAIWIPVSTGKLVIVDRVAGIDDPRINQWWAGVLERVKPEVYRSRGALVGLSHASGGDGCWRTDGGEAWKFYSAVRLNLVPAEGNTVEARLLKNMMAESQGHHVTLSLPEWPL